MKDAIKLEARRLPFNPWGGDRRTILVPLQILFVAKNLLFALQPFCHLGKLVLVICSLVSILCEVNMKPLSVGSVEVVSRAIETDEHHIMLYKVKFGNIE